MSISTRKNVYYTEFHIHSNRIQQKVHCVIFKLAGVFFLVLVVYLINPYDIPQVDTVPAPYLAWSLLRTGDFYLDEHLGELEWYLKNSDVVRYNPKGLLVSKYPPGSGISALVYYAAYSIFETKGPRLSKMMREGKRAGAVFCALSAVVFLSIVSGLRLKSPWLATVMFAFGTTVWSTASQSLWAHGPAVFWITCGLYFLLVPPDRIPEFWRGLISGLCLGMGLLCRPLIVVMPMTLILFLAASKKYGVSAGILSGLAGPTVFFLLYNHEIWGNLITGGYAAEINRGGGCFIVGLWGLLSAPSRGIIFFSPALVVAGYGLWKFFRNSERFSRSQHTVLAATAVGSLIIFVLTAGWHSWDAGWSYGPRLLTEIMPVACIWFGIGYDYLPGHRPRFLAGVLVFLSVLIHAIGVFGNEQSWYTRHYLGGSSRDLFRFQDNQISSGFFHLMGKLKGEKEGSH